MKNLLLLILLFGSSISFAQFFNIQTEMVANMPEKVSNNAVCEGFVNGVPYLYSFTGIDTTKSQAGIHLKSFRYNTQANNWETIANVPDTMGKIAAGASQIGNIIYVIGGYHVLPNGNEISSNKVHRYDINNNVWLTDGANIPTPIDDHVQVVWNDELIYVITGWSNNGNVTDVQIYDPVSNSWSAGTNTPNLTNYKLFGASGTIIKDTIYYYGGAKSGFNFSAGNSLVKGIINPNNPTDITWSEEILDASVKAYRSVATNYHNTALWIGGSSITYNYDGIAYNNSGGVPPNDQIFYYAPTLPENGTKSLQLPMDLRGIANTSEHTRYICGGMIAEQEVTNQTIKITFEDLTAIAEKSKIDDLILFPNPANDYISIKGNQLSKTGSITNYLGQKVLSFNNTNRINIYKLPTGIYQIELNNKKGNFVVLR